MLGGGNPGGRGQEMYVVDRPQVGGRMSLMGNGHPPIVALSSGRPPAAISIVRTSGPLPSRRLPSRGELPKRVRGAA